MAGTDLGPSLWVDGVLSPEQMHLATLDSLKTLGPYGREFEIPLFQGQFELLRWAMVGSDQTHAQLWLQGPNRQVFQAIWFYACEPGSRLTLRTNQLLNLVYELNENWYQGVRSLQLIVRHCLACN